MEGRMGTGRDRRGKETAYSRLQEVVAGESAALLLLGLLWWGIGDG